MTLQNLNKLLDKYEQQLDSGSIQEFELLKDLPFYDLGNPENISGFNHVIGLPQKYTSFEICLLSYYRRISRLTISRSVSPLNSFLSFLYKV